ncbi:MAG: NERD domain-containing protein [Chloroflexota bacterium]|nr:NERD domain-containing protein [Chloroflexota bacterium]
MLIKAADDKANEIQTLEALLERPDVAKATAKNIELEIIKIRAGAKAERDAAYQIDFYLRDGTSFAVIHDLRIEHGGRVAQIDHLLVNRGCDVWVCESKSFAEGVSINDYGEWSSYFRGRARGIASPIEQNKQHISVLRDVLKSGVVPLPKRLGITIQPDLHGLILVSSSARISRPRTSLAIDGLDSVIKCDQLTTTIDKGIDARLVKSVMKVIGPETLETLARNIAALHKPIRVDWRARFGLSPEHEAHDESLTRAIDSTGAAVRSDANGDQCGSCQAPLSAKVADYCRANTTKFVGRLLCWDCQRKARAVPN